MVADTLDPPGPVVEIGSFQAKGQETIADIRSFFRGKGFIGCDLRQGPGVDRIEDVEGLSFRDGEVGSIMMLETLEHVRWPHKALRECRRVLGPEGVLLMTSHMDFPIHDFPSDYWRFSPAAFELLLEGLEPSMVLYQGHPLFPHTVIGIARNGGGRWPEDRLLTDLKALDDNDTIMGDWEREEHLRGFDPDPNDLCLYTQLENRKRERLARINRIEELERLLEEKERELANALGELEG